MVNPLSYFSFQSVFHDWINKGCGICYPVLVRDGAYKRFLAVNWNVVAALAFLSLFEWSFAMHLMPYNHKYNVFS